MLCFNIKRPTLIIKVESSPTLVTPGEGFLKKVFSVDWKPGLPDKLVVNVDAQRLQVAFHLKRIIRKGETEFQNTYIYCKQCILQGDQKSCLRSK